MGTSKDKVCQLLFEKPEVGEFISGFTSIWDKLRIDSYSFEKKWDGVRGIHISQISITYLNLIYSYNLFMITFQRDSKICAENFPIKSRQIISVKMFQLMGAILEASR